MSTESSDYIWHFKLSDRAPQGSADDDLTEMLRQQLRALLGCVVLTSAGENLTVSGFRLLSELETEHALYADDPARARDSHSVDSSSEE
jgi:hypothetical protein